VEHFYGFVGSIGEIPVKTVKRITESDIESVPSLHDYRVRYRVSPLHFMITYRHLLIKELLSFITNLSFKFWLDLLQYLSEVQLACFLHIAHISSSSSSSSIFNDAFSVSQTI
jgi:hypothetical protein